MTTDLTPEFWAWVHENINKDAGHLLLSTQAKTDFDKKLAVKQIECRKKFGKKLSDTLSRFSDFFFPGTLAGEQSTSDRLAEFHARLLESNDIVADLTSGLGIDAMHFASVVKCVIAIEQNPELYNAMKYNCNGLGIKNITILEGDCRELLNKLDNCNIGFIDPARRAVDGKRLYNIKECSPNVIDMLPDIRRKFEKFIIKLSPMLDISETIRELECVTDIYVLGTTTECKEVTVVCDFKNIESKETTIHAVTLKPDNSEVGFSFNLEEERLAENPVENILPLKGDCLLEPYPATMKAGAHKLLAQKFGLNKFHTNTHLYFAKQNKISEEFPGEVYDILEVIPWQSKNLKRFARKYPNVSVSVRNFGMTAEALRNKLGVKEGGTERIRLFGIGTGKKPTDRVLIVCRERSA